MDRFENMLADALDNPRRFRPQRGLHVLRDERLSLVPTSVQGVVVEDDAPGDNPGVVEMRRAVREANRGTPMATAAAMVAPRRRARVVSMERMVVESLPLCDIVGDLVDANLDRVWDAPTKQRAMDLASVLEAMLIKASSSPEARDDLLSPMARVCAEIHGLASSSMSPAGQLFETALSEWAVAKVEDARRMVRGNVSLSIQARLDKEASS